MNLRISAGLSGKRQSSLTHCGSRENGARILSFATSIESDSLVLEIRHLLPVLNLQSHANSRQHRVVTIICRLLSTSTILLSGAGSMSTSVSAPKCGLSVGKGLIGCT